jgi:hypothetical protein
MHILGTKISRIFVTSCLLRGQNLMTHHLYTAKTKKIREIAILRNMATAGEKSAILKITKSVGVA